MVYKQTKKNPNIFSYFTFDGYSIIKLMIWQTVRFYGLTRCFLFYSSLLILRCEKKFYTPTEKVHCMITAGPSKNGRKWDLMPFQTSIVKENKSPLGVPSAVDT